MIGKGKGLHTITFILLIIGGLNWLILGLFNWEIGQIFGGMDAIVSKIIYILVGLSAIYELLGHKKCCSVCNTGGSTATPSGSISSGNTGSNA